MQADNRSWSHNSTVRNRQRPGVEPVAQGPYSWLARVEGRHTVQNRSHCVKTHGLDEAHLPGERKQKGSCDYCWGDGWESQPWEQQEEAQRPLQPKPGHRDSPAFFSLPGRTSQSLQGRSGFKLDAWVGLRQGKTPTQEALSVRRGTQQPSKTDF